MYSFSICLKFFIHLFQDAENSNDNGFSKMDALVSVVGENEEVMYSKSSALQVSICP